MSRKWEERVYRMAAAATARDVDAFLELTDPEVEFHASLSVISEGGAYHGHEGVRQYVRDLDEAFETFDASVDSVLTVGEVAVAIGRVSYRGSASGVAQTELFGWTFRFRDERIVYLRAFREPEAALGAVGLPE